MKKDLVIIGGGPGGYVAAIRAAQLGRHVTLIERDTLGGTCLNRGCIPTKALYRNAEALDLVRHADEFGIRTDGAAVDQDAVRARKERIVSELTGGVKQLLKANGVEVVYGEASFASPGAVTVNGEMLEANDFIIASGSKAASLPVPGMDTPGILDSTGALEWARVPEKLVIVGGGVIGIEMAGIYRAFGAEVTVVEFMPAILPMTDGDVSKFCQRLLMKRGIAFKTGTRVTGVTGTLGAFTVTIEGKSGTESLSCTDILCCTGRVMDASGLCLEKAGVAYTKKGITVDEGYRTSAPHIYAIGDVTGRVLLAHVASEEGRVCVERMSGMRTFVDYDLVPGCIFTFPEIAYIGKTEEQLKAEGADYVSSRFLFNGNGKAKTLGETDGFIKILAARDLSAILGVHIIGPHASDLLTEAIVAMRAQLTVEEASRIMHAHPTLSEAFMECVQNLMGEAIHMAPRKK